MRVWIDQDCCTGAGLCVDRCPEVFIVLEDGIGYVHHGDVVATDPAMPTMHVPVRLELDAVDAAEQCPGECIYLEPDNCVDDSDADIIDGEVRDEFPLPTGDDRYNS